MVCIATWLLPMGKAAVQSSLDTTKRGVHDIDVASQVCERLVVRLRKFDHLLH